MTPPASTSPRRTPPPRICVRCGAEMEERKCKIICATCGSFADCSDP